MAKEVCSLEYVTVDHVAAVVRRLGAGALMAKIDIKSAYRIVPVHPDDHPLLGMKWGEKIFIDKVLLFGLRSAPKIFNALAEALEWVARSRGVQLLSHYLDDFTVVGPPDSDDCQQGWGVLQQACLDLGVPVSEEKSAGPATEMILLGIVIDSTRQELRLPQKKLVRLKHTIRD